MRRASRSRPRLALVHVNQLLSLPDSAFVSAARKIVSFETTAARRAVVQRLDLIEQRACRRRPRGRA